MTDAELRRLVKTWQARLGLRDWSIEVRFVDAVDDPDNYGTIIPNPMKRVAVMKILVEGDRRQTDERIDGESIERTVVHELLHIWTQPLVKGVEDTSPEGIAEEQAIYAISGALVAAYE